MHGQKPSMGWTRSCGCMAWKADQACMGLPGIHSSQAETWACRRPAYIAGPSPCLEQLVGLLLAVAGWATEALLGTWEMLCSPGPHLNLGTAIHLFMLRSLFLKQLWNLLLAGCWNPFRGAQEGSCSPALPAPPTGPLSRPRAASWGRTDGPSERVGLGSGRSTSLPGSSRSVRCGTTYIFAHIPSSSFPLACWLLQVIHLLLPPQDKVPLQSKNSDSFSSLACPQHFPGLLWWEGRVLPCSSSRAVSAVAERFRFGFS